MARRKVKSERPIVNTIADTLEKISQRTGNNISDIFHDFTLLGFIYFNTIPYFALGLKTDTTDKVLKMRDELVAKYENRQDEMVMLQTCLKLLEEGIQNTPNDFLGELFHILELHNKYRGQFFTPTHIAEFMGKCAYASREEIDTKVKERGYFSIYDPCCGAGVMLIGFIKTLIEENYGDPSDTIMFAANDIDFLCVKMCYIQLSCLQVSGYVSHADALVLPMLKPEDYDVYYTPQMQIALKQGLFKEKTI